MLLALLVTPVLVRGGAYNPLRVVPAVAPTTDRSLRDRAVTGRGSDHHYMGTQPLQSAISRSDLLRTVGLFLFLLLLLLGVALN